MAQALILLNDLNRAKSRLAGALSPEQRRALAEAMFRDVVAALWDSDSFAAITVMAGCEQGAELAHSVGVASVIDAQVPGACTNTRVAAWVGARDCASGEPVLLLHADLPFLCAADVQEVMASRQSGEVVIATDLATRGTNAIALLPGQMDQFAWGPDSAARHRELCQSRRQRCRILSLAGFSRDIDTRADLIGAEALAAAGKLAGHATSALLKEPGFAVTTA